MIADYIAQYNDLVFNDPSLYTGVQALMGVLGYTMQIYCDFSGYSDMAIGIALIMGFRLGLNFDSPYQSRNLTEFWRRWHISLSSWLRDYVYIPLGGNRKGTIRTYVNNFLTMLIGGLWHGAAWKFIFWGAMHGAGLAGYMQEKISFIYLITNLFTTAFSSSRATSFHSMVKKSLLTHVFDFHEPVIAVETLLKQGRGASVIVEKTYLPAVFRHDDEHLVFLRLAVELLTDDGEDTVIFTPHVMEITYIPESL